MSAHNIQESKEARFTRSRHAVGMALLAVAFLAVSAGVFILHLQHLADPPGWGWALLPLPFAIVFFWLAWHHTRKPFLVLSRLGIEIYPVFVQEKDVHLVLWTEMECAEVTADAAWLVLTLAEPGDSRVFISLKPLLPSRRPIVAGALRRVMDFKRQQEAGEPPGRLT
ncbi:MAG: hypothetical protein KA004_11425 [Verrucomicrobiales bacterium]|nr:hypothetical protein [Verrucomicrobiales bacterium]